MESKVRSAEVKVILAGQGAAIAQEESALAVTAGTLRTPRMVVLLGEDAPCLTSPAVHLDQRVLAEEPYKEDVELRVCRPRLVPVGRQEVSDTVLLGFWPL